MAGSSMRARRQAVSMEPIACAGHEQYGSPGHLGHEIHGGQRLARARRPMKQDPALQMPAGRPQRSACLLKLSVWRSIRWSKLSGKITSCLRMVGSTWWLITTLL